MFKIGEWVRYKASYAKNLAPLRVIECNGLTFLASNGKRLDCDAFELWRAKKGEWCWFRSQHMPKHIRVLAQFKEMSNDALGSYTVMFNPEDDKGVSSIHYSEIQPFIGQLPIWEKDA